MHRSLVQAVFLPMIVLTSVVEAAEVPNGYRQIAQEQGVPSRILYAIALTESGQTSLSKNRHRPWPWTLNVAGKGQYYSSRRQAWLALEQTRKQRQDSVDIGLMQVNWRYHHRMLQSSWQALDPYHNLRVGAAILRACQDRLQDWWQSVGCYHAPNNEQRADRYRTRVKDHWRRLTAPYKGRKAS